MTYETAPATLLVASNCAACGRALVDAISVETGMGPDCREKHGYGDAQGAPDFEAASALLVAASAGTIEEIAAWAAEGAQTFANKLVHRVAANVYNESTRGAVVLAIAALGFVTLSHKLASRALVIEVTETDTGSLKVVAPFSPAFNEAARQVPGMRGFKEGKTFYRTAPKSSRGALWMALKKAFPAGTPVFGSKGTAVL